MNDRCPHCHTPYGGDLDENGKPFCECTESVVDQLTAENDALASFIDALNASAQALIELVESNMADTCAWCIGRDGKHDEGDPESFIDGCDAVRVLAKVRELLQSIEIS